MRLATADAPLDGKPEDADEEMEEKLLEDADEDDASEPMEELEGVGLTAPSLLSFQLSVGAILPLEGSSATEASFTSTVLSMI